MSRKINLTLEKIRNLQSEDKRYCVIDSATPGLQIWVTPAGTKTFKFRKWVSNHGAVTVTIGKFPTVTLDTARKKSKHLAGEIALHGRTVIEELQAERQELTFNDLFESWFNDQKRLGKRDLVNLKSRYENHIKIKLGNKRVSTLTEKFLKNWFLALPNRKKKVGSGTVSGTTANRCLSLVSAVLSEKSSTNPAKGIAHFPEEERERYLSGDELGRLFEALEHPDTPENIKDIVLLALTTGARKMNILSMSWADIDFVNEIWVIPAGMSKNKKSMGIPLIPEAIEILERRKKKAVSFFVFPSSSKQGHVVEIKRSWNTVLKRAGVTNFVFHDLRRTSGSWQAHIGSSDIIIGKSLGHKCTQSTRVYARIRDNNPIKESMAGGFAAMKKASKEKRIVNIRG